MDRQRNRRVVAFAPSTTHDASDILKIVVQDQSRFAPGLSVRSRRGQPATGSMPSCCNSACTKNGGSTAHSPPDRRLTPPSPPRPTTSTCTTSPTRTAARCGSPAPSPWKASRLTGCWAVDENGDVIDGIAETRDGYGTGYDFGKVVLENLKRSGVQQAHKEDRIKFTSLTARPGQICLRRRAAMSGRWASGQWSESEGAGHRPPATDL